MHKIAVGPAVACQPLRPYAWSPVVPESTPINCWQDLWFACQRRLLDASYAGSHVQKASIADPAVLGLGGGVQSVQDRRREVLLIALGVMARAYLIGAPAHAMLPAAT